jgi:hypothetical protein
MTTFPSIILTDFQLQCQSYWPAFSFHASNDNISINHIDRFSTSESVHCSEMVLIMCTECVCRSWGHFQLYAVLPTDSQLQYQSYWPAFSFHASNDNISINHIDRFSNAISIILTDIQLPCINDNISINHIDWFSNAISIILTGIQLPCIQWQHFHQWYWPVLQCNQFIQWKHFGQSHWPVLDFNINHIDRLSLLNININHIDWFSTSHLWQMDYEYCIEL